MLGLLLFEVGRNLLHDLDKFVPAFFDLLMGTWELEHSFISLHILWNEDIASCFLVEGFDGLAIGPNDYICDLVWYRKEKKRAWEGVHFSDKGEILLDFPVLIHDLLDKNAGTL